MIQHSKVRSRKLFVLIFVESQVAVAPVLYRLYRWLPVRKTLIAAFARQITRTNTIIELKLATILQIYCTQKQFTNGTTYTWR